MSGSRIGGIKTKEKNLAKDPDYYRNIGRRGGMSGRGDGYSGGFAAYLQCDCSLISEAHHKGRCSGKKGGLVSRRKPKNAVSTH